MKKNVKHDFEIVFWLLYLFLFFNTRHIFTTIALGISKIGIIQYFLVCFMFFLGYRKITATTIDWFCF